jgi:hypothetical protein
MKYFLGLVLGLLPAIASVGTFNSPAAAQSCANYWVNPQTGQQECLTVTSKPSFLYLGKRNETSREGKKVVAKFYIQKNITVTGGMSKPFLQVTIFSHGYRFDDEVVIDCNNYAIAYKSESVTYKGKLKGRDEYETLEFEPIRREVDSASQRMYSYVCNGVIPKP